MLRKVFGLIVGYIQQDVKLKLDMMDLSFDTIKIVGQHDGPFFADDHDARNDYITTAVDQVSILGTHITGTLMRMADFSGRIYDSSVVDMLTEVEARNRELSEAIHYTTLLREQAVSPPYFTHDADNPVEAVRRNANLLQVYMRQTISSANQQILLSETLLRSSEAGLADDMQDDMTKLVGYIENYKEQCATYAEYIKHYPRYIQPPVL